MDDTTIVFPEDIAPLGALYLVPRLSYYPKYHDSARAVRAGCGYRNELRWLVLFVAWNNGCGLTLPKATETLYQTLSW